MLRWLPILGLLLGACARGPEPARAPSAGEVRAFAVRSFIAPCPPWAAPPAPDRDQVFVELLVLDAPDAVAQGASLAGLPQLAASDQVELLAVPKWLGDFDQSHAAELVDVQGPTKKPSLHRGRLTARRADPGLKVLDVELTLQLPNPSALSPTPTRSVSLSLSVRDGQPALGRVRWDSASRRSLLLVARTHPVRGQEDLREIFHCKMRAAQRARTP